MLAPGHQLGRSELAKMLDHTLLKANATAADFESLFDEAVKYGFWSVCVPPSRVSAASVRLRGKGVKTCTVVGFPLGYSLTSTKVAEARRAIQEGADEIDMVMNIGAFKGGDLELTARDIRDVRAECGRSGRVLKVIIECCYLTDLEKVRASQMVESLGAGFVKTSTGFGPGGATSADVALIRRSLTGTTRVKASGGISSLAKALEMIRAGADRIGTSSGAMIMEEFPVR